MVYKGGQPALDEQEPDETATHTSADAILRDYRYKLQCMYMEPSRDLRVAVSKKFETSFGLVGFFEEVAIFERSFFSKCACLSLQVRPVSIFFDPTTVYGSREGFASGLVIVSKDKANYFAKSTVWKSGVVYGVGMLPRILAICLELFLIENCHC